MSGTQGERAAAEYIEQQFKDMGFETEREEFSFSAFALTYGVRLFSLALCISLLGASYLQRSSPLISAFLAGGMLLVLLKATKWGTHVERVLDFRLCERRSENIIARPPKTYHDKPTVICMAHYDTKAQTMPIAVRGILGVAAYLGALIVLLMILANSLFVLCGFIEYLRHPAQWLEAAISYGVYSVCLVTLVEQLSFTSNASPGALDNASGVSVLLELGRALSSGHVRKPTSGKDVGHPHGPPDSSLSAPDLPEHSSSRAAFPLEVNVIFVVTGAEEFGLCGAVRFIQRREGEFDRSKAWFLNYDCCGGSGDLAVLDRYGFPAKRTSTLMSKLALDVSLGEDSPTHPRTQSTVSSDNAQERQVRVRSRSLPIGVGVDSMPMGFRGFEAITISTHGLLPLLRIHSKRDTVENVSQASLQAAGAIGLRIIEKLSRQSPRLPCCS